MDGRQLMRWELDGVDGAVVVIDVIRAFTTAAYALGAGASHQLLESREAARTRALSPEDCHPLDIEFAAKVDRFDCAMEVTIDDAGRRLERR